MADLSDEHRVAGRRPRLGALAAMTVVALLAATAGTASGQDGGLGQDDQTGSLSSTTTASEPPATTEPVSETTTSGAPTTSSSTTTPASTTTSTAPTLPPDATDGAPPPSGDGPQLPDVPTDGSGTADDGIELDADAFLLDLDGRSLTAVSAIPGAHAALVAAIDAVTAAQEGLDGVLVGRRRLDREVAALTQRERNAAQAIDETTAKLAERAVAGYVAGPESRPEAWLSGGDGGDLVVQEVFLDALARSDGDAIDDYRQARADATTRVEALGDELRDALSREAAARSRLATAVEAEASARLRASILEVSSGVAFTFPVSGGTFSYSNDWGFARSGGRRHEGTDIFGPRGTPLVAVESGTVTAVKTGKLGGNVVWLRGDSGHRYYYAHLDAFWPGVIPGTRLAAGEPLGRLGDTGNAKGTPTHLHFEIHPASVGGPVNPYPVLRLVAEAMGARTRQGGSSIVIGPGHRDPNAPAPWTDYTTTEAPAELPPAPVTTTPGAVSAPPSRRQR